MYFGRYTVGRVQAILASCGVQKMACMLVSVQLVRSDQFMQAVVCWKVACVLVGVRWVELELLCVKQLHVCWQMCSGQSYSNLARMLVGVQWVG